MQLFAYRGFSQIATLKGAFLKDGRSLLPDDLDIIKNGSIVFGREKIEWVGPEAEFPEQYNSVPQQQMKGKTLVPELVDAHTHLVFGGDRSHEYARRLNGVTYEQIAKEGGGILFTMECTHKLKAKELFELGKSRILTMNSFGVGTIEIKSGYGLTYEKEYELSHVISDLKNYFQDKENGRVQILNTYMAAHSVPKVYPNSSTYMKKVVIPLFEKLVDENIIDAVDIFHEQGYFDETDVRLLFEKAKENNVLLKSHADEFNDNHGAELAVSYKAISTDHLLRTNEKGIRLLGNSDTVAVLLPGTGLFLGKPQADARKFLDKAVKVAIATDFNPGSCHFNNLIFLASIMAPQYKMNLCELWAAITLNSSHALGLRSQGAIVKGLRPRFTIFNTDSLDKITYNWGTNLSDFEFSKNHYSLLKTLH